MKAIALLGPAAALAALLAVMPAAADAAAAGSSDLDALRGEVEELKRQVRLLQEQLAAVLAQTPQAPATPPPVAVAPPVVPAPAPGASSAPAPPTPGGTAGTRIPSLLNPALSAVFQMIGNTSLVRESEANGFDLSEAEIALQSDVDPFTRVDLFVSLPADESPEIEEGFITTVSLPGPLQLRGGRFKSAFGKWNLLHNHAFFTVERPDVLGNVFGDESLTSDGLSLSVLIPNPWDLYIDAITEIGTARPGASFNSGGRHLTFVQRLTTFFNPGPNSTIETGLSAAFGKTGPGERLTGALDTLDPSGVLEPRDDLDARVYGLDVTWKWIPVGFNVYRSFLWQTEVLKSRLDIDRLDPIGMVLTPDRSASLGGYSYLEWQFAKRWRAGARYDVAGFPDSDTARERSASGVVRFRPSEFQELRFQVKRTLRNDEAAALFDGDGADTRIFFEWIPAIGAHGAHKY